MAIRFDNIEAINLLNNQGEQTIALTNDQGIIVSGNVAMATGNATGKFAVKSTGVHASYDFYNNGTSYFNGGVVVDAGLSQTGGADVTFTGIVGVGSTGVYAGTNAALNLPGKGIALKNDKAGSNNNWSYINNTATSGQSNINFATGQASAALTLAHSGNATFAGDVNVTGDLTVSDVRTGSSGGLNLGDDSSILSIGRGNEIWTQNDVNGSATLYVNYRGYNGGSTQFRSLDIRDGKAGQIASFNGSDKSVSFAGNAAFAGAVSTGGYLTLNSSDDIPRLIFNGSGDDFFFSNTANYFGLYNDTDSRWDIKVDSAGDTTFGGGITTGGDINVPEYVVHNGDTNTHIRFTADRIRLVAGGTVKFDSNSPYITGVDWTEIAGDAANINISGFNNDAGYLTALPSHNHNDIYYTETELNGFFKSLTHQGNYISTANWSNDDSGTAPAGWSAEGFPFSPTGQFAQNGEEAENTRTVAELPNGAYGVVWRTPSNDAASGSDGGWNMDINNVQHAKAYRSVVYFQKTDDSTSGTFYHGCHGSTTLNMDGSANSNPYFHTLGFSNLVENRWYVSIGYIQPYQYPTATNSTRSGIYDCYTGKKIQSGTDYMMKSGSTTQRHRTFQYYSTDPSSSINWWSPRFEEINGNEPSLAELIQRVGIDGELGLNFHSKFPAGALASLSETTDATNDKILLWDESADEWKQMTLEDLQDSIDTDTTNFATAAQGTLADNALPKAGGTMTGALTITHTGDGLTLQSATDTTTPVGITFTSQGTSATQKGHVRYNHRDGFSYGSAESFTISGTEATTTILADGKLMYAEGIYSKPSSGTGGGTRRDANWNTAYGWGDHSAAGYGDATQDYVGEQIAAISIPSGNAIIDWTADQGNTNIHSGNYSNTQLSNAEVISAVVASSSIDDADKGTIRSNIGAGTSSTDTVYTHPTTAGNKHIPAGGAAGEFLKYSADGTAVWATPSYTTNTNTTYSAGTGLDLTGTTFSVEPDLRDGITHVGKDSNNYIQFDSTNGRIDFYAGGVFVARMESDGDLHMKGDVIAFSDIF